MVREAVLEAAARLFAERGVERVSLRSIAEAADVKLPLIGRYIGRRSELIDAVFERLSGQVVDYVEANPLEPLEYGRDSMLGRWMTMVAHYTLHEEVPQLGAMNPVRSLAGVLETSFGIDARAARLRAAQVTAISLGWRLFEDYLISSTELDDVSLDELRSDLNAIQQLIGSAPLPTPGRG